MRLCIISFLTLSLLSESALAVSTNPAWVSLVGYYSSYQDLKASSAGPRTKLAPSIDGELGLRIHSLFQLTFDGGNSQDNLRQAYGMGLRVDLPGFFFFGFKRRQISRQRRNYPLNSSIFGQLLQMKVKDSTTNAVTEAMGSASGLAIDIFLFNPVTFLALQAAIYNLQGNSFTSYSAGLGVEF